MKSINHLNNLFIDLMTGLVDLVYPDPDKKGQHIKRWQAWLFLLFLAVIIWLVSMQDLL